MEPYILHDVQGINTNKSKKENKKTCPLPPTALVIDTCNADISYNLI